MSDDTQRQALLELAYRAKNIRYKYFQPNIRGEEFADAVGSLRYFISLYSAANGVGKSTEAVNMLANIFWPGNNKWFKGPLFQTPFPFPVKKVRICSDPQVVENIVNEMKLWFPVGRYVHTKGRKSYDAYWKTDTGFDIEIMTYDQDPKEFEGGNVSIVWCDEPPPQNIFKANVARLRRGGLLFITATPLSGSEWMFDEILSNPNNEEGKRFFIEADVEQACIEHAPRDPKNPEVPRGHLKHQDILNIIAQYNEEDKQARVLGKPQHLTGLIFKQFNPKIHVINPFQINLREFAVYHFLDPHPRTNDAGLWVAVNNKNQKFVVDELWLKCQNGTPELAYRIQEINQKYRVVHMGIDPSAFIEDQHAQTSLHRRLADLGLYYTEASKARSAADRRIGDALNFTEVGGQVIVAPEVFIFNTCPRTIYELQHYRWDEWTGKSSQKHGQKQKPLDKDDHMIESLGRCLFSEPVFQPYMPVSEYNEQPNTDPYA